MPTLHFGSGDRGRSASSGFSSGQPQAVGVTSSIGQSTHKRQTAQQDGTGDGFNDAMSDMGLSDVSTLCPGEPCLLSVASHTVHVHNCFVGLRSKVDAEHFDESPAVNHKEGRLSRQQTAPPASCARRKLALNHVSTSSVLLDVLHVANLATVCPKLGHSQTLGGG